MSLVPPGSSSMRRDAPTEPPRMKYNRLTEMSVRSLLLLFVFGLGTWGVLRAQRPFREYPGLEYENFPLPPDYQEKTEWTRARLRYPGIGWGYRAERNWTIDYPRSDRHLLQGVRRLTRI